MGGSGCVEEMDDDLSPCTTGERMTLGDGTSRDRRVVVVAARE